MFFAPALSFGQKGMVGEFEPVCDSLAVLMSERTGVQQELKLKQIVVRGKALDFYFDQSLSDFPFRKDDYKWLCSTLQKLFPLKYKQWKVGEVYANRESASGLAVAPLRFSGGPLGVIY